MMSRVDPAHSALASPPRSARGVIALVLAMASLSTLSACGSEASTSNADPVRAISGTLLQRWSIDGESDAAKCDAYGAARMRLVVYDEAGEVQATQFADCAAFAARLTLAPRTYTGKATFVGASGDVVSATQSIDTFIVAPSAEIVRTVDFPTSAMHPPTP